MTFIFMLCSLAYFQDHSQIFTENKCVRHSEGGKPFKAGTFSHFSEWQYKQFADLTEILNILESLFKVIPWLVLLLK